MSGGGTCDCCTAVATLRCILLTVVLDVPDISLLEGAKLGGWCLCECVCEGAGTHLLFSEMLPTQSFPHSSAPSSHWRLMYLA
jgi:hypothetical protein